ncbi:amidase [Ascidiaceihabitans sp.]|uniref:amidase n=1 Tax=Ascidiaceihabitans sp. TaxID=1872644 RepID=UPI00329A4975
MTDLSFQSALTLSEKLADGTISASDVMQSTLDRVDAVNGTVNAIVSLRDNDALMAEARHADETPRKGWLHGIPIAIKDLANAKGLPTSMGSPLFAGQMAQADDVMVARLRDAGAIVIGKTNTPEFGLGSHTFNPVFGATRNPYGPGQTAGGSSGGAAVALATGMLCVADGSDMMGSLRNPAAWNNVYGMRPTFGLVPSEPQGDTFLHQNATNGPMARNPKDLAALLDTMSGPDPRQPHGIAQAQTLPALNGDVAGLRVGWLGDWGGAIPLEDGIDDLSQTALRQMSDMGCVVDTLNPPFSPNAIWDSWTTLRAFNVSMGLRALYEDETKRQRLKPSAQWEIEKGLALSATEIHKASAVRSGWFKVASHLFDRYDVIIAPSAQVWPFDVALEYPKTVAGQTMDTYHRWMEIVIAPSLLGLPVVNIPMGFGGPNDLPMGLQLIGRRGADAMLLRLAQNWHLATDWPNARRPILETAV